MSNSTKLQTATLAGGCFWCTEAVFQRLKGVERVTSGYANSDIENPTYEQVSYGETNSAEAIQVEFDPDVISYRDLLDVFWRTHNPTTLNQQGNDIGTQYRSGIFYSDDTQKQIAEQSKHDAEAEKIWPDPIVTEIVPLRTFYKAEGYHQNYYNNTRSKNPYCTIVIDPKIQKLKKDFSEKLKGWNIPLLPQN